jgi:hypothetical protein
VQITVPKSGYAQLALVFLVINAFGALAVGIPLLLALGPTAAWLPPVATAWGIASLIGAYGVWRFKRWTPWLVIPTQGLVAIGLLATWLAYARDWSVLLVAGIAAGAATFVALDRLRPRR